MSQPFGQPKTLQIGVVLPPLDQYREGNLKDRLAASMPLFVDHHDIPGVTAVDLAIAHPRDVQIEKQHGVRYLTCWFDPTGAPPSACGGSTRTRSARS